MPSRPVSQTTVNERLATIVGASVGRIKSHPIVFWVRCDICRRAAWLASVLVAACGSAGTAQAVWTLVPRGSVVLDTAQVVSVAEMSGVTYLGSADGVHQFAAVQDDGGQLVRFTAGFDTNGAIQSAVGTSTLAFGANLDFEGIAYTNPTRQSVFVSAENTPTIYEYSLADGMQLQTVAPPPAFDQQRSNRGLESLTRSLGGTRMWTANEEALSIDGPLATPAAGTTVRLQQFDVMGDELAATRQFAYEVDPIHLGTNPDRSGVADLVEMPNGALLVLERSAASFIPPFENRIYEVDLSGATDTSASEFDTGLAGQSYAPAGKSLLWSG